MSVPEVTNLSNRKNHVIVCGYSSVGKSVAQHLEYYGSDYIFVDNNPKHVRAALKDGVEAYLGDMSKRSILEALHVKDSAIIIITLDNVDKKLLICEALAEQNKVSNVIVKVVSVEERAKFEALEVDMIVDSKVEVARVLVERGMSCSLKKVTGYRGV